MNLDEWVSLVKTIGPSEFKLVGVEFLREQFGCIVQYTDGTGDGGVDAWVVLQAEPRIRRPAQFYAGAGDWETKVSEDVKKLASFRDSLSSESRADFEALFFICTQTPSPTKLETVSQELRQKYNVVTRLFDARAIASLALQNRTSLLDLLAARLPRWHSEGAIEPSALEEALVAFSFFHGSPSKYRWAVAKSGIATILHRNGGIARDVLLRETASLLGLREESTLPRLALRNLVSEGLVTIDATTDKADAAEALAARTSTTLKIARQEEESLRVQCATELEPLFPKGTHERERRAREAADSVLRDLGALVRGAVVQRALRAVDAAEAAVKEDQAARERLAEIERRLVSFFGGEETKRAVEVLIALAAKDPFARRLAAAELFVRLTEHDASELERALDRTSLRVVLDASVAMPILCVCYDMLATTWPVSVAAHALYGALKARQAVCVVPSVYVEEMASHLLKAQSYAAVIAKDADLERSANYFVAHYCSTRTRGTRTELEFRAFLKAFGAVIAGPAPTERASWLDARARAEREITRVLARYKIDVVDVVPRADAPLPNERPRADVLLVHDRAVVRDLQKDSAEAIVCTADSWLQEVLTERGITALDSAALADLLELVRPTGINRPLVTPMALAHSLSEDAMTEAARVWDTVVGLEGEKLDWKLIEQAREFRDQWLVDRRRLAGEDRSPDALSNAWTRFRDEAGS